MSFDLIPKPVVPAERLIWCLDAACYAPEARSHVQNTGDFHQKSGGVACMWLSWKEKEHTHT